MPMEIRKIVVLVEEVEVAKAALEWAIHNILRYGDHIILLHVFPITRSRNNKKQRVLRLKGFQLALSFKELCDRVLDAKVEIIVREGDQEGVTIAATIREIGASDLVFGLHDQSFLYRMTMAHGSIRDILNCRVLAIKQPMTTIPDNSPVLDFSLIEIAKLSIPRAPPRQKFHTRFYLVLTVSCGDQREEGKETPDKCRVLFMIRAMLYKCEHLT